MGPVCKHTDHRAAQSGRDLHRNNRRSNLTETRVEIVGENRVAVVFNKSDLCAKMSCHCTTKMCECEYLQKQIRVSKRVQNRCTKGEIIIITSTPSIKQLLTFVRVFMFPSRKTNETHEKHDECAVPTSSAERSRACSALTPINPWVSASTAPLLSVNADPNDPENKTSAPDKATSTWIGGVTLPDVPDKLMWLVTKMLPREIY